MILPYLINVLCFQICVSKGFTLEQTPNTNPIHPSIEVHSPRPPLKHKDNMRCARHGLIFAKLLPHARQIQRRETYHANVSVHCHIGLRGARGVAVLSGIVFEELVK